MSPSCSCPPLISPPLHLNPTLCLSRLMPLVLECMHAYDAPSRAAASGLLYEVVCCILPRAGTHAALLWEHLLSAFCRDGPETSRPLSELIDVASSPSSYTSGSSPYWNVVVSRQKDHGSQGGLTGSSGSEGLVRGIKGATTASVSQSLPERFNHQDLVILNILATCRILASLFPSGGGGGCLPVSEGVAGVSRGWSEEWAEDEQVVQLKDFIKRYKGGAREATALDVQGV